MSETYVRPQGDISCVTLVCLAGMVVSMPVDYSGQQNRCAPNYSHMPKRHSYLIL